MAFVASYPSSALYEHSVRLLKNKADPDDNGALSTASIHKWLHHVERNAPTGLSTSGKAVSGGHVKYFISFPTMPDLVETNSVIETAAFIKAVDAGATFKVAQAAGLGAHGADWGRRADAKAAKASIPADASRKPRRAVPKSAVGNAKLYGPSVTRARSAAQRPASSRSDKRKRSPPQGGSSRSGAMRGQRVEPGVDAPPRTERRLPKLDKLDMLKFASAAAQEVLRSVPPGHFCREGRADEMEVLS